MNVDKTVWERLAYSTDTFRYQVGPIKTETQPNRPSYLTVKRLLTDIYENTNIYKYRAELVGGVLFTWDYTFDVDLLIFDGSPDYLELEEIMLYSVDRALNKYHINIDISYNYARFIGSSLYLEPGTKQMRLNYRRKQINDGYHEYRISDELGSEIVSNHLAITNWKKPHQKLIDRAASGYPLINQFNAKTFIETDESYFNSNSNR